MLDEININSKTKEKKFTDNKLKQFNFLLKIIYFIFSISLTKQKLINIINFSSEIHLVIIGKGNQSLLNHSFYIQPSQVLVNGINKDSCKLFCDLEKEENNVTLIFNDIVQSTQNMFRGLSNIKEIDLSLFDFSKVRIMSYMFGECTNLVKINFGNINTSSVTSMIAVFYKCKNLVSLDVSKFNTLKVGFMNGMFYNCFSLRIINLSNFNTSKVRDLGLFLYNCQSIISIDVSRHI